MGSRRCAVGGVWVAAWVVLGWCGSLLFRSALLSHPVRSFWERLPPLGLITQHQKIIKRIRVGISNAEVSNLEVGCRQLTMMVKGVWRNSGILFGRNRKEVDVGKAAKLCRISDRTSKPTPAQLHHLLRGFRAAWWRIVVSAV